MSDYTTTPNYGLYKPTPNADVDSWGAHLNSNADTLDAALHTMSGGAAHVLDFGAKCDGTTDDTTAVNAAIAYAMSMGGGIVQFPRGTCLMLGAMVFPYTNMGGTGVQPMQSPVLLRGAGGANYGWNGQNYPQQIAGTVLDMRYGGGDSFGHVAKIDTRGMGTLQIEDITLVDGGTSNFLFIQTTNTVLKVNNCRFRGNLANNGTTCIQDAIRLGGITAGAMGVLQTDSPLAGFQGYGSFVSNCQFDSIRECVQFGEAANIVLVQNCTVNRNCGSAKAQGAPYYFYGMSGGEHGNIISGGFVEMVNYPYAVAMIGVAINRNVITGLGLYDEVMGSPTLGGVYFDTGATFNTVIPGYVDFPMHAVMMAGPSARQNTLMSGSGASAFQSNITVGTGAASPKIVIDGGNTNVADGAATMFATNGTTIGAIGNYSAAGFGGAYNQTMTIYGANHGILIPSDKLGIATGAALNPLGCEIGIGDGSGERRIVLNGGNTNTADGSLLLFYNNSARVGGVGNASSYFNTPYAIYNRATVLAGYDALIFSTHDLEAGRVAGSTGTQRWLIGTPTDDTTTLLQVGGTCRVNGNIGFNNTAPIAKPTVTGAKGSNAALASLLTALAAYGLVTDTTTA